MKSLFDAWIPFYAPVRDSTSVLEILQEVGFNVTYNDGRFLDRRTIGSVGFRTSGECYGRPSNLVPRIRDHCFGQFWKLGFFFVFCFCTGGIGNWAVLVLA